MIEGKLGLLLLLQYRAYVTANSFAAALRGMSVLTEGSSTSERQQARRAAPQRSSQARERAPNENELLRPYNEHESSSVLVGSDTARSSSSHSTRLSLQRSKTRLR